MNAPAGGGRGGGRRGEKNKGLRELSAISPTSQAPGVQPTSREALAVVPIARRQAEVFGVLCELHDDNRRPSDTDLADRLGWPISWLTPRRRELAVKGHIIQGGNKLGRYGRRVLWWRPTPFQFDLFAGAP